MADPEATAGEPTLVNKELVEFLQAYGILADTIKTNDQGARVPAAIFSQLQNGKARDRTHVGAGARPCCVPVAPRVLIARTRAAARRGLAGLQRRPGQQKSTESAIPAHGAQGVASLLLNIATAQKWDKKPAFKLDQFPDGARPSPLTPDKR